MKTSVIIASLACAIVTSVAMPLAHAGSQADLQSDAARSPATLISYSDATPRYTAADPVGATVSGEPVAKDAVRAEVIGQLRETVRDSELAGLKDIYSRP